MQVKLTLPVPTSLNRLYINQANFNPKTRQYVPTGKRILSPEGRKTKARLIGEARVQMKGQDWDFEKTKTRFVYQDIVIHFARRGTDADNTLKLLNDSMEGIVFFNDSMLLSRIQKIYYNTENPHIEIAFSFSDQIGIFDSQSDADNFESICQGCTRYRNGSCSILKDSLIGTVREEVEDISNPVCSEFKTKKSK